MCIYEIPDLSLLRGWGCKSDVKFFNYVSVQTGATSVIFDGLTGYFEVEEME